MIKEFRSDYRWLSNFEPVKINLDGVIYPSVEHAYMSAKSNDIAWKEFCANPVHTAGYVKKSSKLIDLVDNWDTIKVSVMKYCIEEKFSQEPFKSKLLNTGKLYIQEGNNWNDTFWGVCLKTGVGHNILGGLIMEVRDSLT